MPAVFSLCSLHKENMHVNNITKNMIMVSFEHFEHSVIY